MCFLTFQCQVDCVCIVYLVCGPCCFFDYTSLHCVVNITGFGHFAVFLLLFFGEQAQNILMLIPHIAGLCENFHMDFFFLNCIIQISFLFPNVTLLYQSIWAFS